MAAAMKSGRGMQFRFEVDAERALVVRGVRDAASETSVVLF